MTMSEYSLARTTMLTCHPAIENPAVQGITARVGWAHDSALALNYTLTGDCSRLRIPSTRPQARIDGLWQHTCFEMFVSAKDSAAYWEFNFSPSSEWAAYQFHNYRNRTSDEERVAPPKIVTHRTTDRLELGARLHLPHSLPIQSLRLALSAVIEDESGRLSYWALKHAPGKPDFHHPDAFVLEIVPPQREPTRKENG